MLTARIGVVIALTVVALGGSVFAGPADGAPGDATAVQVANINPSGSSSPGQFATVNGTLYFAATDGVNGTELWRSDGTTTTMVEDAVPGGGIAPGAAASSPTSLTNVNGTLFFRATDVVNGSELWKADGNTATLVEDAVPGGGINPGAADAGPDLLTNVNGTLFFRAITAAQGDELWKSDGTTATLVEDAVPGGGINPGVTSSSPNHLTNVNGTLFFRANDGTNGVELWKSDGATATLVEDAVPGGGINPGAASSAPTGLTNVNGTLFFGATTAAEGEEPWQSDGTTATLVEDAAPGGGINPGAASSLPTGFTNVNGTVFFAAITAAQGDELWKSDGDTATLVEDAVPGGGINPGAASSAPAGLTNVNGKLFFSATTAADGHEAWKTDGATATLIEDAVPGGGINPGAGNSSPGFFTDVNGSAFFNATSAADGGELWKSDGVTATLIEDAVPGGGINPGAPGSFPALLTNVNGTLFFAANDGTNGGELWKSDGTTATLVEDAVPGGGINPGVTGSIPANLTGLNGTLFFSANGGSNGIELWKATIEGPPVVPPTPVTPVTPATPPPVKKKCKKAKKKGKASASAKKKGCKKKKRK